MNGKKHINRVMIIILLTSTFSCKAPIKQYDDYIAKAFASLKENKYEEAYSNADNAVKLNQDSAIGYLLRGRSLYEQNRAKESLKDFSHVLNIDSNNTAALYYTGLLYYDYNKYDSASLYLNKAIVSKGGEETFIEFNDQILKYSYQENITMASLRYFRGLTYYYNHQYNLALDDLDYASKQGYNKSRCYYYIGLIAFSRGAKDIACKYFKLSMENGYEKAKEYLALSCN